MRPFRPGLLLLFCSLVSASLSAQQSTSTSTPQPTSDAQAVALVQRALLALTAGVSVSDVTLTGTAHRIAGSDEETGTATLTATSLGDSKVALSFPSGNRTEIRNHSALPLPGSLPPGAPAAEAQRLQPVGAWSGPDSVSHGMATDNVLTDATYFFPPLTIATLISLQNHVVSFVGQETREGQTILHVAAMQQFPQLSVDEAALSQRLSQMDLYLDPTTFLPLALAFNVHPDGDSLSEIPFEVRFSDYRTVGGIQVPFHVQRFLNNTLQLDLDLSTVTLNAGLTATSFALE